MYENIWIHYWWQRQVEMSHKLMSVLVPRPENDPVSHYWKHSKSFNWRNIWTWLWAPSLSPWASSMSQLWGAEPWQLNPATKSLSLATSLPICRCRIPAILLPVIVLCKVVLCQIRFTSYNFVPSFKACVVHHITLLSDSTAPWTYSAIYWHLQTFPSQDVAACWIMKQIICRKIIRDSDRFL